MGGVERERATAEASSARKRLPLGWLYSSFPDGVGGGNPAGVVVSSEPLETDVAQAFAAILSVPTTGFVVAPLTGAESTVEVRFFTPDQEIAACGHVTIAIAAALVEQGIWEWGDDVTVRARGGESSLRLRDGRTLMTQHLRVLDPAPLGWREIEAALGPIAPHKDLPLAVAGTGLRHLVVPLADTAALAALDLDAGRIAALAASVAVETICVWAPTMIADRVRVRDLCAAIGALEEPASGTTAAALALYLVRNGALSEDTLVIEQGVEMGRPSRVDVKADSPRTATVQGGARKILSGPLELWG